MPKGKKVKSLEDLLGRSVKIVFLESGHHSQGKLKAGSHPDIFWIEIEEENPRYQTPEKILLSRSELELDRSGTALFVRAAISMDSSSMLTGEI